MMTEKQNREIEAKLVDKLEDVKKEMSGAIRTVSDRQDRFESEQTTLKDQMLVMQEQMKKVVAVAEKSQSNEVSYSEAVNSNIGLGREVIGASNGQIESNDDKAKVLKLLELGQKTVGLHPFSEDDIAAELKRGAKDETEAKLWAVQVFLRYEMNIKSHVLATFTIENIFPPAMDNWDTIYVTFNSVTEANTVFSYTRNMRKEVKVGIYIPNEWKARFNAINAIAYKLRYPEEGQPKNKTRVKWGSSDLILYKKAPGARFWSIVDIVKPLPPVDLNAVGTPHMSPAPGRQGREAPKRARPSGSGSDSDSQYSAAKSRKTVSEETSEASNKSKSDTSPRKIDKGRVVEEESYCPSSPAPHKSIYNSPIFKSKPASSRMNPLVL